MRHPGVLLASLLAAAPAAMSADIASQPTLTLEGAKRIAAAAVAYARAHDAPGAAIAIVDAGGHTMYLERLDGTFAAGSDISIGKARTAVAFKRATRGKRSTRDGRPWLRSRASPGSRPSKAVSRSPSISRSWVELA